MTATCTTAGTAGNVKASAINRFPVTLPGLTAVTNASAFAGGYAAESDTDLLERYLEKVSRPNVSGNKYHYEEWAKEISGVGSVQVLPLWNGAGTVKVVITDLDNQPASSALVQEVQEYINDNKPIGANVTVVSATSLKINISAVVDCMDRDSVKTEIEIVIQKYLAGMALEKSYVSYAKIGGMILALDAVEDYSNLRVNGGTANITLGDGVIKNGDTAFYFRELGLMAYDPDEKKDILYAYTNAGDGAALMPDNSAYVVRTLDLSLTVNNAANITANVTHKAEVMRDEFTEHTANTGNPHKVSAAQLFPSNSTVLNGIKAADVTKWNGMIPDTQKGAASGVAELDSNGKVPSGQLPSYVDDVLEYETKSKFPSKGESGKIYVDTTANLTYRWSGSQYVEISQSLALGETAQTAYRGDRGKTAYDHSQAAHAPTTAATQSAMGLMSAADKKKLDGVETGAQKHIAPTKTEVTTALGYTPPSKDTTYDAATQSADGLMSAADKKKLDGVEAGAQKHIAPTKTEIVNALGYTPPEKDTITPVDITLSESSANPVRNSTVTKAINDEKSIREEAIDTLVKEVRDSSETIYIA